MAKLNFSPFPVLSTSRLVLRQLVAQDDNALWALRNDARVNEFIDRPKSISMEEIRKTIDKLNAFARNNESIFWAISLKNESPLIGTICLWNIEADNNSADMGYELSPAFHKQGFMQEALTKVIEYGFNPMQLSSIAAWTHANNQSSINLLERNNFKRDLNAESAHTGKDYFKDMVIYCLRK